MTEHNKIIRTLTWGIDVKNAKVLRNFLHVRIVEKCLKISLPVISY
jgi:hypothetical protein